jgi:tRNA-dihydrouridine synthase 3
MAATAPASDLPEPCPAAMDSSAPPPTPEELVARAVAPVKAAFLRPPPVRDTPTSEESRASGAVPLEKKSKRQFRRERKQVTSLPS